MCVDVGTRSREGTRSSAWCGRRPSKNAPRRCTFWLPVAVSLQWSLFWEEGELADLEDAVREVGEDSRFLGAL